MVDGMSVVALRADRVLLADGFVPGMNVLIADGMVVDVCPDSRRPLDASVRMLGEISYRDSSTCRSTVATVCCSMTARISRVSVVSQRHIDDVDRRVCCPR